MKTNQICYATVGICNNDHTDGMTYTHAHVNPVGAPDIEAGRAIFWTTAGSIEHDTGVRRPGEVVEVFGETIEQCVLAERLLQEGLILRVAVVQVSQEPVARPQEQMLKKEAMFIFHAQG